MNPQTNTARDLAAELDAEAEAGYPESWRPKPGDKIVGRVLRYTKADSPYGEKHIVVLKVEANAEHGEHTASVWLSHAALLREFKSLRPRPGEKVGIKRLGDREKSSGGTYAMYLVRVDRPAGDAAPDWDELEVGDE